MSVSKTKVPRKGVLLLGSGYGALKVAEDVAQAGIPVVWVTRAQHFRSGRRIWISSSGRCISESPGTLW